ncbi:MAG: DUF4230 domain-containing protein [Gemmatimonadota bacterium]
MLTRYAVRALLLLVLVVGGLVAIRLLMPSAPVIDAREVRERIYTSVEREASESFLVTGSLQITTTLTVDDTRVLFPNTFDISLGTTRATVRVPGIVSYGFDVRELEPEMIHVSENLVEIELPMVRIYSAEPELSEMEVETSVGWARMRASAQDAERVAVRRLGDALRRQGEAHLESSMQPRVNTAKALEVMVLPVLESVGFVDPQLRFLLGEGVLVEAGG